MCAVNTIKYNNALYNLNYTVDIIFMAFSSFVNVFINSSIHIHTYDEL